MEQKETFVRFMNELANNLKHLSSEKFDETKLAVVNRQFSYVIEKLKEQDVEFIMILTIFVNCYRLFDLSGATRGLHNVLDSVFKQQMLNKLAQFDEEKKKDG